MAFRADEEARSGFEEAVSYLTPRDKEIDLAQRTAIKDFLLDLVDQYGPAIDAYPNWHPLVCNHEDSYPVTTPGAQCGYQGLDHTRFFANAFITCPYGDGQKVLDSVAKLPFHPVARITAERLDMKLYNINATPILVKCDWYKPLQADGMIPLRIAMALILAKEIPSWESAQVAETWESMRPYFLGRPHGARSSLFVNQETGTAIKKVWEAVINTGIFGPIKV